MGRILLVIGAAALFVVWLMMRREVKRVGERLRQSEAARAARMRRGRQGPARDPAAETLEIDPATGVYRPRGDRDDARR